MLLGLDEDASWVMAKLIQMQQAGESVATTNVARGKMEASGK